MQLVSANEQLRHCLCQLRCPAPAVSPASGSSGGNFVERGRCSARGGEGEGGVFEDCIHVRVKFGEEWVQVLDKFVAHLPMRASGRADAGGSTNVERERAKVLGLS